MPESIEFTQGRSKAIDIMDHISKCEISFINDLKERVNLSDYANKIYDHAHRFEAWYAGELIGIVAIYCNNNVSHEAFISNVSVLPCWQGKGIASILLTNAVSLLYKLEFNGVKLQVNNQNVAAIALYEKFGFFEINHDGRMRVMQLNLI